MTSLRERAAGLAGREPLLAEDLGTAQLAAIEFPATELPEIDIPDPGADGPEQVPVHLAWLRVRQQVRAITKDDKYNGGGTRYNFRGIDRALNAFGPACLLHGVNVLPVKVESSYRDTFSAGDKKVRECTVQVTYRIYGPAGDFIEAASAGESLDSGDKGTAKALSTSLRSLLLLGGLVPTTDPDPELSTIERGEAPIRSPQSYLAEILDVATSRNRLLQIHGELMNHRQTSALVTNERGVEEPIGEMVVRVGKERFTPSQPTMADQSQRFCERCEQHGHNSDKCPTLDGGAR